MSRDQLLTNICVALMAIHAFARIAANNAISKIKLVWLDQGQPTISRTERVYTISEVAIYLFVALLTVNILGVAQSAQTIPLHLRTTIIPIQANVLAILAITLGFRTFADREIYKEFEERHAKMELLTKWRKARDVSHGSLILGVLAASML